MHEDLLTTGSLTQEAHRLARQHQDNQRAAVDKFLDQHCGKRKAKSGSNLVIPATAAEIREALTEVKQTGDPAKFREALETFIPEEKKEYHWAIQIIPNIPIQDVRAVRNECNRLLNDEQLTGVFLVHEQPRGETL